MSNIDALGLALGVASVLLAIASLLKSSGPSALRRDRSAVAKSGGMANAGDVIDSKQTYNDNRDLSRTFNDNRHYHRSSEASDPESDQWLIVLFILPIALAGAVIKYQQEIGTVVAAMALVTATAWLFHASTWLVEFRDSTTAMLLLLVPVSTSWLYFTDDIERADLLDVSEPLFFVTLAVISFAACALVIGRIAHARFSIGFVDWRAFVVSPVFVAALIIAAIWWRSYEPAPLFEDTTTISPSSPTSD